MTNEQAFALATRKARYGHRDWIVWQDRNGEWSAKPYSADAIKTAMLAVGTNGRFTLVAASTAIGHRYGWAMACLAFRNARFLAGAS